MGVLLYADRVWENTSTIGTGTLTLIGALVSYQTFTSAFSTGQIVYYALTDGVNWEVGQGTFTTGGGGTLSRDVVFASSNAGALVNLTAGGSVWCDLPAQVLADKAISLAFTMHLVGV